LWVVQCIEPWPKEETSEEAEGTCRSGGTQSRMEGSHWVGWEQEVESDWQRLCSEGCCVAPALPFIPASWWFHCGTQKCVEWEELRECFREEETSLVRRDFLYNTSSAPLHSDNVPGGSARVQACRL
jgi:hypothetical protein